MFDRAIEIMKTGAAEKAVWLMDIPDNWGKAYNLGLYEETFDAAVRFQKAFPDTLWCYGNHDVSYPWGELESGYSIYAEHIVISKLNELERSLQGPEPFLFLS
jgi:hypothetical protein